MEPLGVLLLSGVRHQTQYAPLLAAHPRLRLVALADEPDLPSGLDAANARLAANLGLTYARDVQLAVGQPGVDLAVVCSEPTRHARLAALAARAGKHVLVDKPMALTVAEADLIAAAVASGGGQVSFVHRLFSPAIQRLRSLVDEGRLGVPWALHVSWLAAGGLHGQNVEDDALVANPRLSGGGELANFLSYPVGTIRYLTGLEVESVYAATATHFHAPHQHFGVEDFGVLSLTLARGVLATITVGRLPAAGAPGSGVFSIRMHGSHASIMIDEERPRIEIWNGQHIERSADNGAGTQSLQALIDDFVTAIDQQRPPLCTLADGRALTAVLQAAYASAATHKPVRIASVTGVA